MTFTSSYEQDASVITALRSKLVSPAPEPQQLYSKLQQWSISVVGKFKLHPGLVTYDILSTLLQQMQTAELFGNGVLLRHANLHTKAAQMSKLAGGRPYSLELPTTPGCPT